MTNEKSITSKHSFNVDEAKWYIIRGHSGAEAKIIEDIKKNALLYKVPSEYFVEFFVPSIAVETFKQNVKVIVQKSIYPGYIIVKMKMNENNQQANVRKGSVATQKCNNTTSAHLHNRVKCESVWQLLHWKAF